MTDQPPLAHLSENHRNTLYHLERHPTSHNLEWPDVLALLKEVADVTEQHNGTFRVRLGESELFLSRPHDKDVDEQTVMDVRRLLRENGTATGRK
ncbi:hypothetical protein [Microbacterium hatanonis]|uniref:Type II toxin-antitoxin system HicA family toxin n=1 Tax=Microbacterium hatanonis TaxID=404366 RepID=A0A5C8I2T4_9MICO|nr:hypothetical protein [Microbacterium hatanonis]TXK12193.1 hypothetical protein FVP77_01500 [Microbacterium hatanonis]